MFFLYSYFFLTLDLDFILIVCGAYCNLHFVILLLQIDICGDFRRIAVTVFVQANPSYL